MLVLFYYFLNVIKTCESTKTKSVSKCFLNAVSLKHIDKVYVETTQNKLQGVCMIVLMCVHCNSETCPQCSCFLSN